MIRLEKNVTLNEKFTRFKLIVITLRDKVCFEYFTILVVRIVTVAMYSDGLTTSLDRNTRHGELGPTASG